MNAFSDAKDLRSFLPEDDLFTNYKAVLGEGDEDPDLLLLSYQPNGWDVGAGKPLMGKYGLPIRRHMVQRGATFYATHNFPFFRGKDKAKADDVRQAAPVIAEELRRVNPSKVLLLGADAARFCPGFDYPFKKFTDVVGRSFHLNGVTYRVAHAPAAIANSPQVYGEFTRAVEELLNPESVDLPNPPEREHYVVVENQMQAKRILQNMPHFSGVAVDLETAGLNPWRDRILTIQVSWEEGTGYAFPWDLMQPDSWAFYLGTRNLIFQNGTFDVKFLAVNGVHVQIHEDTMLMHSLVDETPGTHSMELMAQKFLGIDKWSEMVDYDQLEQTDLKTLGRYGARDTDITLRLANHFRPQVEERYIHQVLHRAQNAITRSELRGVRIDREKAQRFREEIESALYDREVFLRDTYGLDNANSPKQVAELLYGEMGIPTQKMKGKTTTSSSAISPFADQYPVVRDILEYRHLTKAGSTYVANILAASEHDGRYHAEFKLAATETGRVAEKLITLIPRPDSLENPDLGKQYQVRLRELFIPDPGHVMIGADYRGLEVGMAAYLTNDPQLISDYNSKLDTHSVVAIQAFNLPIDLEPRDTLKKRVQAEYAYQRELAKRGTFTWLYGGTEPTLRDQLNIDLETASQILEALRARYQGVAAWQEAIRTTVRQHGSVTTPWGRTRRFLLDPGMDRRLHEDQLREAINAPNQGMSSDVNLAAFAAAEARGFQTLMPFHDAIYMQAPVEQAEAQAAALKEIMETTLPGAVKFEADVKIGPNWAALE